MKIYYFNDEKEPLTVQVHGQLRTKEGGPIIEYHTLKPQEYRIFEVDAPADSIPYLKRWENRLLLLSYLPSDSELFPKK